MQFSPSLTLNVSLVILGGAFGSLLRYLISQFTTRFTSGIFPYATLLVNFIGCFLIGYLAMRIEPSRLGQSHRLFWMTGLMGAFTTFSTFSLETVNLFQNGHIRTALMNITSSNVVCLLAVVIGMRFSSII